MEYKKKPQSSVPAVKLSNPVRQVVAAVPVQRLNTQQTTVHRQLQAHTNRPVAMQRQAMQPALRAAALHTGEVQRLASERQTLQRQAAELSPITPEVMTQAVQRQQAPAPPVPTKPQSVGDWVTVMRFQAEQAQGRRMGSRESLQYTALQRQVANTLAQGFRQDRQPASARHQQYAGHLATLQRQPGSAVVATAALNLMPASERPAIQRAMDEVLQREAAQQAQESAALRLHSLQRQLDDLEHEATKPVFDRIQARRGSGNPLPEAVQRHLEQGLNHDLSAVRIHDDAEADKLSKGVNAIAFTTGTDIFFQAGKFNPNTQTGLELLAHEVTHTVQQAKGEVGKGIDPDSGLESQARAMGQKLAKGPFRSTSKLPPQTARMSGALQRGALQRLQANEEPAFLKTLTAGQAPPVPFAFVWQTKDGGVQIRESIGGKVLGKVANATRLQLLRYDPKQGAYAVRTPAGVQGWVAASHLKVPPPALARDTGLRFYVPKKGEGVFGIVSREYGASEFGEDARYFTNVLRAVNQPAAFSVKDPKYKGFLEAGYEKAITAMTDGRDANGIQLIENVPFWLPSPAAAKTVKAPSGSFSKGVLDTTKKTFGEAGEAALYGGLFLTGLQIGLLKSLWDALVGLIELVKLPLTVVRSIYNVIQTALQGQLLNKVQEIYAFLAGGGLKQIASMLIGEFKAGWDNKNPLKAWEFRGQVIGYIAAEIITTFIPIAGLVLKAAKAGKVVAFLSSKFKWIGAAGQKAMQMLDKVKVKWPPAGMSPQMAMAGGMSMSTPQREVSLGQVLRMARNKVGNGKKAASDSKILFPQRPIPIEKDFWRSIAPRKDDIKKVAKLVGLSEEDVAFAKKHLMIQEHLLVFDKEGVKLSRFTPNADDAILWQKVIKDEKLTNDELQHLKALINHEFAEAKYLKSHPHLMERFLEQGDLTKDLIAYITRAKGTPPNLENEPHPMTPYRYAHLVVQYTTSAQQPKSDILLGYEEMGLIKFDRYGNEIPTSKGKEFMGLK